MDDMTENVCFSSTTMINDINIDMGIQYEIYDCRFNYTGDHINHINLSGMPWNFITSRIQKNSFNNNEPMTVATNAVNGINVTNMNSALELWCNDFNSMGTDIQVGGSNTIKLNGQGNANLGAGNSFSAQTNGRFRLNNASGSTVKYYLPSALLGTSFDPLTSGYFQSAMGLDRQSASSNTEGDACKILCSDFITGVNNMSKDNGSIRSYPNPANDQINFDIQSYNSFQNYTLYDMQGKEISSGIIIDQRNIIIPTADLINGFYIIQFTSPENRILSQKFIVQH